MPMKGNVFSSACKLQIEHILVVLDKKYLALILSITGGEKSFFSFFCLKTSDKWLANKVGFYSALLAHEPHGFLNGFSDSTGGFTVLVPFHRSIVCFKSF